MESRIYSRILRISATLLALLIVLSMAVTGVDAADNGYYIDNYDVDIVVNEDNTFNITETIKVYFDPYAYKHGIIRNIPLSNTIYRQDGTSSTNRVRITDLSVNYKYTKSTSDGNLSIRIGDADKYVRENVTYVIKYKYDIGKDPLKDKDEFYFNIIGTEWDTSIGNVTFKVRFPEAFDASTLGFTTGYYGSTETAGVEWDLSGNTVTGRYTDGLPAYSGLTMRMELPEGYFYREPTLFERIGNWLIAIPVALFAWVLSIYRRKGSNQKPVEPVEFYPPDGMSPLDVGYIYDGSVDKKDITAYLIHLANQGYLEIGGEGKYFEITLLRDKYEGDDPYEEIFFDGLKTRSNNGVVERYDLTDSFYEVINYISRQYKKSGRREELFEKTAGYRVISIVAGVAAILISGFMLEYLATYDFAMSFTVAIGAAIAVGIYVPLIVVFARMIKSNRKVALIALIFIGLHMLVMLGSFSAFLLREVVSAGGNVIYFAGIILGALCIALAVLVRKRTPYGNETLGRIMGFRNFLVQAEKPKLEELVEQEPAYFYNILPYTYVLGVSDKWIKKFEAIAMEPPTWYSGSSYDTAGVMHSIDSSMSSISSSMTSSPSSDSGGGSGGGSSGGGSGGGGGSSW